MTVTRDNANVRIEGRHDLADFVFILDYRGKLVTYHCELKQPMPEGFDVETERRTAKQGGCCGTPAE